MSQYNWNLAHSRNYWIYHTYRSGLNTCTSLTDKSRICTEIVTPCSQLQTNLTFTYQILINFIAEWLLAQLAFKIVQTVSYTPVRIHMMGAAYIRHLSQQSLLASQQNHLHRIQRSSRITKIMPTICIISEMIASTRHDTNHAEIKYSN